MRNIKLILEYDGSKFFGFQRQRRQATVQEALEKALSTFFQAKMKISAASGRTDTGVHAAHQVVNFKTQSPRSCEQIQKALNGILPRAIAVKKVEESKPEFHARYQAKRKTYEYLIWNAPVRAPLLAGRSWHLSEPLDLSKMRKAAKVLTGRHDFRSFSNESKGIQRQSTVRTIRSLSTSKQGSLIRIRVTADGFLYRMVRNLTGVLVQAGRGKLSPSNLRRILKARDRRRAPAGAPAHGLTLVDVTY